MINIGVLGSTKGTDLQAILNAIEEKIIDASIKIVISNKENAFFSVNVVARKPEKNTPNTNPYMKKFLFKTPWKPKSLAVFAGKIDYPKYNFIDKHMIRFIMWMTKGPTDTKNTYEFTDWSKVDSFAVKVIS